MKTAREFIQEIRICSPSIEHISKTGVINGSFLIDLEKAMEEYASQFKNIIDAIEEGSNQWKQEYDDSRSILNKLVYLKDLKDNLGKTKEYYEK